MSQKNITTILWSFILLFLCLEAPAQSSVLSDGYWVKLGVTESGIYKIDYNLLSQYGFNPSEVDPQSLAIFGNGGGMLPQANTENRIVDLFENAIWVSGEDDGSFDQNDYILFYAQSPHTWSYDFTDDIFKHQLNKYSDTTFYFLTVKSEEGKRLTSQVNEVSATVTIRDFEEHLFYEPEEINIVLSGREWYSTDFGSSNEKTHSFPLEGLINSKPLKLTTGLMANGQENTQFNILANSQNLGLLEVLQTPPGTYDIKGRNVEEVFTFSTSGNNLLVQLNFIKNNFTSSGYLNYLRLQYSKSLQLYSNQTQFRSIESLDNTFSRFEVSNTSSSSRIWDITNPLEPKEQQFSGTTTLSFGVNTETLKEFIVFDGSNFASPISWQFIPNQNLRGVAVPDLVIITPELLRTEAERLANFRRQNDGLDVLIVTDQQVYNEFSSGRLDVSAIRDFMRHLYQQDSNKLKYLLLFGDPSFDFKDIKNNNLNLIPIYESRESLHPIYSYSSDDYFGFLEDDEGEWVELIGSSAGDHTVDIGVGRLPVKNLQEAQMMVDKLVHYEDTITLGKWRTRVAFIADDGDANIHQNDAERLADSVNVKAIAYNTDKLYLDSFEQIAGPSGETAPELVADLNELMDSGALIVNYTGHGGEIGWAEEGILTLNQIDSWENYNRLPLLITATCEFGRYDSPDLVAGAEKALLSDKGGCIGLITTTRPVFSNTNFLVNRAVYDKIFELEDGEYPRLGDIQRAAKNGSLAGSVNRNFSLLGDPSMQLVYPEEQIVITKVNDKEMDIVEQDTVKALSTVKIEGELRTFSNQKLESYTGVLDVEILDKAQTLNTRGNENPVFQYSSQENALFRGKVTVTNGNFTINFVVPKDIDYSFGQGKWSFYAQPESGKQDAAGAFQDFIIGGTNEGVVFDNTPPEITLFMNDESFQNGGTTDKDPILLIKLSDENGINTSQSGIGHEITSILDDSLETLEILNAHYVADLDTYQSGAIRFPYTELPIGRHTVTVKAWDTFNNSSEKDLDFVVVENASIALEQVLAYPNPMDEKTNFQFLHDQIGEDLIVQILIYDQRGTLRQDLLYEIKDSGIQVDNLTWDGRDSSGNRIGEGIYLYKVIVTSPNNNKQGIQSSRLVVIK